MAEAALQSAEPGVAPNGPVQLCVPPEPSMSRVARLAASGLASLAGCTVDEIEDIKIAVSEVLIALIEHGEGGRVDLEFDLARPGTVAGTHGAAFVVRGRSPVTSFALDHPDLLLCRTVLEGVCSSAEIGTAEGHAQIVAVVAMAEPN